MNRTFFSILTITLCTLFPIALSGQIDNLTNMSADWIRMANRNAASDAVDIVVYNPAGLTKLAEGFHLNLSNQTLVRNPKHTFDLGLGAGIQSFSQDGLDPVLPNLYAAYKKNNWCIFGGVYIPGGGATVNYPNGSLSTQLLGLMVMPAGIYDYFKNDYFKVSSLYLATTVGGAYAFNDVISISAGVRYIRATNKVKLGLILADSTQTLPDTPLQLETKETADGVGGVFGIDFTPIPELNIGIRYETKIKLEFETGLVNDDFGGTIASDGDKYHRDFPGMLGVGVSYNFSPKFRAEVDFNYFFQKQANWGILESLWGEFGYSDLAGDCYSIGAAFNYQAAPKLQLSAGFLYTKFKFLDINYYYTTLGAFEVLYSDNVNIGAGLRFDLTKKIKLSLGAGYTIWKDETIKASNAFPLDVDVYTANKSFAFAVGFDVSL